MRGGDAARQAESEALREAARALLAAATDPRACASPRAYAELLAGSGPAAAPPDAGGQPIEVRPRCCHGAVYVLKGVHSRLMTHGADLGALMEHPWRPPPATPGSHVGPAAAQAHSAAERAFEHLAVAGAACALHPLHVPDALVAATAGALADAACGGARGGRQALAAALLAEGLAGPLAPRALPHLGPLPALTQRCGPGAPPRAAPRSPRARAGRRLNPHAPAPGELPRGLARHTPARAALRALCLSRTSARPVRCQRAMGALCAGHLVTASCPARPGRRARRVLAAYEGLTAAGAAGALDSPRRAPRAAAAPAAAVTRCRCPRPTEPRLTGRLWPARLWRELALLLHANPSLAGLEQGPRGGWAESVGPERHRRASQLQELTASMRRRCREGWR